MRVGLGIETDSPGGAEMVLFGLARELSAKKHDVVAFGPHDGEGWLAGRLSEIGVEWHGVDLRKMRGFGCVRPLASLIRANDLDVFHSHEFAMAFSASLAARMTGCRHVITIHGWHPSDFTARRRLAFRLAMALSASTVAVSAALAESLHGPLSLSSPMQVVHNGVAPFRGQGHGQRIREELEVGPTDLLVLAVGNLWPWKGHEVLLKALARTERHGGRVVVAIAGAGPLSSELEALGQSLGLGEDLHLLGLRSDIEYLLDAADVYVMPSLREGLPMALVEAMMAGKPVVASDVGGIPEVVTSDTLGLLVPPGDVDELARGLSKLLGDPSLRAGLGMEAGARARAHFSASEMVENYLALYRS